MIKLLRHFKIVSENTESEFIDNNRYSLLVEDSSCELSLSGEFKKSDTIESLLDSFTEIISFMGDTTHTIEPPAYYFKVSNEMVSKSLHTIISAIWHAIKLQQSKDFRFIVQSDNTVLLNEIKGKFDFILGKASSINISYDWKENEPLPTKKDYILLHTTSSKGIILRKV